MHAKASRSLQDSNCGNKPGHGGVAIMWNDNIRQYVRSIKTPEMDRMCAVEVCLPSCNNISLFSVYLPHAACTIADYSEQLDNLEKLVCERKLHGDVIIMEDINAHFGKENGLRCWGRTTPNGEKFLAFAKRNYLEIVDIDQRATGQVYTFTNDHGGMSYIDHCTVSAETCDRIRSCWVFQDCVANTSDHLAVGVTVSGKTTVSAQPHDTPPRIKWDRLDKTYIQETYTSKVETAACTLLRRYRAVQTDKSALTRTEDTDLLAEDLKNTMHAACSGMPTTEQKRQSHLKSYWAPELTVLSKEEKARWKE